MYFTDAQQIFFVNAKAVQMKYANGVTEINQLINPELIIQTELLRSNRFSTSKIIRQ